MCHCIWVHVSALSCTQGEMNQALLYATLALTGTYSRMWTVR